MKNKIRKSIFIILTLFIACSKQSPTTLVGEAIIANVANPEEGLDLEYLWEFTNLPDQSSISNSDIDSEKMIFPLPLFQMYQELIA